MSAFAKVFLVPTSLLVLWSRATVAQTRVGEDWCGIKAVGGECKQAWRLINDENQYRRLEATIVSVAYNATGGPTAVPMTIAIAKAFGRNLTAASLEPKFSPSAFDNSIDDKDLNLWVKPDPAYDELRNKRAGHPVNVCTELGNLDKPGQMELEIFHAPGLLLAVLENGMHIRAFGFHVEDSGHCDKAELHPVNQIIAARSGHVDQASSLFYFHGLDWGDRFTVGTGSNGESQTRTFEIDMHPSRQIRHPSNATSTGEVSFVVERSFLDINAAFPLSSWEVQMPSLGNPVTAFTTTLLGQGVYLAQIDAGRRAGFTDQMQTSIRTEGTSKFLEVTIQANLSESAVTESRVLRNVRWVLDDGSEPVVRSTTGTPHRFTQTLRYSPGTGATTTQWRLAVRGRADDGNAAPRPFLFAETNGALEEIEDILQGTLFDNGRLTSREFIYLERDYVITPSTLALSAACDPRKVVVDAQFAGISGAGLKGDLGWSIVEFLTPPVIHKASRSEAVDAPNFRAEVSATNPWRLIITPKRAGYLPPLTLTASAETEISETLRASVPMDYQNCPWEAVSTFFENLLVGRLELARQSGRPGPFPDPNPLLFNELREAYRGDAHLMVQAHSEFLRRLAVSPRNAPYLWRLAELGRNSRLARPDQRRLRELTGYDDATARRRVRTKTPNDAGADAARLRRGTQPE